MPPAVVSRQTSPSFGSMQGELALHPTVQPFVFPPWPIADPPPLDKCAVKYVVLPPSPPKEKPALKKDVLLYVLFGLLGLTLLAMLAPLAAACTRFLRQICSCCCCRKRKSPQACRLLTRLYCFLVARRDSCVQANWIRQFSASILYQEANVEDNPFNSLRTRGMRASCMAGHKSFLWFSIESSHPDDRSAVACTCLEAFLAASLALPQLWMSPTAPSSPGHKCSQV
jgi:hypothetical protein